MRSIPQKSVLAGLGLPSVIGVWTVIYSGFGWGDSDSYEIISIFYTGLFSVANISKVSSIYLNTREVISDRSTF